MSLLIWLPDSYAIWAYFLPNLVNITVGRIKSSVPVEKIITTSKLEKSK